MDLQPFFNTDRTKRLDSLPPERRKVIEDEAQASGQGDAHTDKVLVGMWLSERTGLDDDVVDGNFDEMVKMYFGANDNASSAYTKIAAHYGEYTALLDEQRAILNVKKRAEAAKYLEQSGLYAFGATATEGAANTALGAAEGALRQVSMGAQKMRAPTLYGYGTQSPAYGLGTQVAEAKMPEEGAITDPYEQLANTIWGWKNDVTQKFDVDPEFKKTIAGVAASGLGSFIPQIAVSFLGPEATVAVLESSAFSEATDRYWNEKNITPEDATQEQKNEALRAGLIYAVPSSVYNKIGLDKWVGRLFKGGAKARTKRELMVGMGKAFGAAAAAEVPTELADYVLGDVAAKVTYAPDTEMFTPEKLREMGVIAIATALSAGTVGAGVKGFRSVRGKRGGKIGPDGVEYATGAQATSNEGQQAQATAEEQPATEEQAKTTPDQAATGIGIEGDPGVGILWTPEGDTPGASAQDIAILKQQNTKEDGTLDEQAIVNLCENEDAGLILVDAVKGDEQARKEYNMLLAGEDAKGMRELSEEEMDEIRKELDLVSDDASVEEETDFTPSKREMAAVEELVYGALESNGRTEGMTLKDMRLLAREMAGDIETPEWNKLLTARAAKALKLGKLSKSTERRLLAAARASDNVLFEKIFHAVHAEDLTERLQAAKEKGRQDVKLAKKEGRENVVAVRAEVTQKFKGMLKEKGAAHKMRMNELRDRLDKQIKDIRKRNVERLIAGNTERARKELVRKVQAKASILAKSIADAKAGKKRMPYANAKEIEAYLEDNYYGPSETALKEYEELMVRMEDINYSLTDEDLLIAYEVNRPRIGDKDLTPDRAAVFWATLNNIIRHGRALSEEKADKRAAKLRMETDAIVSEVTAQNKASGAKEDVALGRAGFKAAMKQVDRTVKRFGIGSFKPETIFTWLTGREGNNALSRSVTDRLRDAGYKEYHLNEQAIGDLRNMGKANGIDMSQFGEFLVDGNGKHFELNGVNVTRSEAAAIYAYSKSETGRAHLFGVADDNGVVKGGTAIGYNADGTKHIATPADVTAIVAHMPASYVGFVDDVVNYLSTTEYERVNNLWYKDRFGVDMDAIEAYFPIRNLSHPGGAILDMMEHSGKGGLSRGFSKARTGSVAGFNGFDFMATLVGHIQQVNHVIAYDKAIADVSSVLEMNKARSGVADAMRARHPDLYKWFSRYLEDIRRGTPQRSVESIERTLETMRTMAMRSSLGYRPTSGIKVISSFGPGARYIRPAFLAKEVMTMAQSRHEKIAFMMGPDGTRSPEVKARVGAIDKLIRDIHTSDTEWRKYLEDATDINQFDSWVFMRIAELNQTTALWTAKYNEVLMDTNDSSAARRSADWVIEQTQQTGNILNLSQWQRGNAMLRLLMPFKNDVSNEWNSLVRILVANGTKTEKAKRLVSYAVYDMAWPALVLASANKGDKVLSAFLIGLAASAGLVPKPRKNKNEKRTAFEQWRDDAIALGLMQPISAFPMLDNVVEYVIKEGESKLLPYKDEKARVRQYSPDVFFMRSVNQLYEGKYASAAGTALGIPLIGYLAPIIDEQLKGKEQKAKQPR